MRPDDRVGPVRRAARPSRPSPVRPLLGPLLAKVQERHRLHPGKTGTKEDVAHIRCTSRLRRRPQRCKTA